MPSSLGTYSERYFNKVLGGEGKGREGDEGREREGDQRKRK
jgi:hypothetical protein